MKPSVIAIAVAIAMRLDVPYSASGWSISVFRQARRADLRTGYAGPKVSVVQRLTRWLRGAAS